MTIVRDILVACSRVTGFPVARLISQQRRKELVSARHAVVLVARDLGFSFPHIGRVLNRDHTSMLHAIRVSHSKPNVIALADDIRAVLPFVRPMLSANDNMIVLPARAAVDPTPKAFVSPSRDAAWGGRAPRQVPWQWSDQSGFEADPLKQLNNW